MIGLLCVFISSFTVVDVSLTDGQEFTGNLKKVTADQVTLDVDGVERVVQVSGVAKVIAKPVRKNGKVRTGLVELLDGSKVSTSSFLLAGDATCEFGDGSDRECSVKLIRCVRYFQADGPLSQQWDEILSSAGNDDYLVVNKKGNLDYLAGTITLADQDKVVFDYGGNSIDIPLDRVAGLVFAKRPGAGGNPKVILTTNDGSSWNLSRVSSIGADLQLESTGGAKRRIPMADVLSLEFLQAGAVYLSDMKASEIAYRPFLESSITSKSQRALGKPVFDKGYAGKPIALLDENGSVRTFKHGLAVQSRSELTYRLAGKFDRFQATVGFDPDAPAEGHVELKVFADDKQIFRKAISQTDKSITVDVMVAKANRMRLLVDYGNNLDIGDRLHFGDARFIK